MPYHDLTRTGRIKRPSIAQVSKWVKQAWGNIKLEFVVKSFKTCGISNSLNGTKMTYDLTTMIVVLKMSIRVLITKTTNLWI